MLPTAEAAVGTLKVPPLVERNEALMSGVAPRGTAWVSDSIGSTPKRHGRGSLEAAQVGKQPLECSNFLQVSPGAAKPTPFSPSARCTPPTRDRAHRIYVSLIAVFLNEEPGNGYAAAAPGCL
ncbi:unnamed protein product [Lampetra planeri]